MRSSEDVAAPDDDGELGPGLDRLEDLRSGRVEALGVYPVAALAREALSGKLEDDAANGPQLRESPGGTLGFDPRFTGLSQ